jgi:hypothetical protein
MMMTITMMMMMITTEPSSNGISDLGFESRQGQGIFFPPKSSTPALGPTRSSMQQVTAFLPGLKRRGRVPDHSIPSSVEVHKKWSFTSAPLYTFMAWAGTALPFIIIIIIIIII